MARCKDCRTGKRCIKCRVSNHKATRRYRKSRLGKDTKPTLCFRCLREHVRGERNCPLAAEYEPLES